MGRCMNMPYLLRHRESDTRRSHAAILLYHPPQTM